MISLLSVLAGIVPVTVDALIITPDGPPNHFVARAHIPDLQPSQMAAAIMAVEDAIRQTYPRFTRCGWRAASDGLYLYFESFTPSPATPAALAVAA